MVTITLKVNGKSHTLEVEPRWLLADVLRNNLRYTGTHIGCEHGVCGACTVLMDGAPVRSCLLFAVQANDREIRTVEGLEGPGGELNPLQHHMREHHGLQCGFCTPGILMSLTALFESVANPSEAQIRDSLQGHICRCTGYQQIVEAALEQSAAARVPASQVPAGGGR